MLKSVEGQTETPVGPGHSAGRGTPPKNAERPQPSAVIFLRIVLQAVIAAAVVAASVLAFNFLVATKPEIPTRPARETVYVIETIPAAIGAERPILTLYGEVVAARTVELRALVAGEIVSVNDKLQAGAVIPAGETLVAIDDFAYKGALVEAQSNLLEARAQLVEFDSLVTSERDNLQRAIEQLEFARRDLERAEQLVSGGAVTERTLDDRRLIVSQRQQQVEQRRNALAVQEAKVEQKNAVIQRMEWRVEQAERNLRDTVLKTPFDAIVRSEAAAIGRLVGVNDVVASLYDRDTLEVRFTLSDNQYGRLIGESGSLAGREVELLWYLGAEPVRYRAVIQRTGADVAAQRGGIDVFARIVTADADQPLRPGAFVEISVPDRQYEGVLRIPETALYNGDHVYVVRDDRMARRDVQVLAYDGGEVIVRGDFETGEPIVTTQIAEAGEGLLVRREGEPRPDAGRGGKSGEGAGDGRPAAESAQ